MNNQLFSNVNCDFYTCHYELNPQLTGGLQVTIYAECVYVKKKVKQKGTKKVSAPSTYKI